MTARLASPALLLVLSSAAAGALGAQGAMRAAPSGRATTEIELTLVDSAARAASKPAHVRIDYGQPHLRGRRLLTDSLVPYDKPWRTGANGATLLTTDVDLTLGGARVPKGRYILQTLPTRAGWKLLVQRDTTAPGMSTAIQGNPAGEIARVDLRQSTAPAALESLTFWLIPSTQAGAGARGELRLAWGTVALATDWVVGQR